MDFLPGWLQDIFLPTQAPGVAASLFLLFFVMGAGILIGKIKYSGISIGMAGIMLAGILAGHLGYQLDRHIMEFLRDLGLIMFVFAIGMQVGPSFFSLFKMNGLRYNAIAAATVLAGGTITIILLFTTGLGMDNLVGIMSGAITNTPGLGAAKETLQEMDRIESSHFFKDPANAYAITYPFGVLSLILMMVVSKSWLKIDIQEEIKSFEESIKKNHPSPMVVKCRITNPGLFGKTINAFLALTDNKVVVTRLKHSASVVVELPLQNTVLKERDVVMLVGMPPDVEKAVTLLGRISADTLIESNAITTSRIFVVTSKKAVQKTIEQLILEKQLGVQATRVYRAGIEMMAGPNLVLHFGDRIKVVGDQQSLEKTAALVGNSTKRLQEPQLLAVFIGVLLGVLAGSIPLVLPNLTVAVKLGMAAGPLMIAMLISRMGSIGGIHAYLDQSVILFMRDFGICLFFAVVGIQAGGSFLNTFIQNNGWLWVGYGMIIAIVPMVLMVVVSRKLLKINFVPLLGIMAGAYTDPAALAFSRSHFKTDLPTQAYATVYPLVTVMRILMAQLLVLYFVK